MVQLSTEKKNVFDGIITSKMRVRILMRLFLNPSNNAYLRELAKEFGASPGQLREELSLMSAAELLKSKRVGRQVFYRANQQHSLYPELNSMVRKALGMDHIVDSIIQRLGNVELALLLDDYAQGKDMGLIDLAIVGNINDKNLRDLVTKTERHIQRKIRTIVVSPEDFAENSRIFLDRPHFVLWSNKSDGERH